MARDMCPGGSAIASLKASKTVHRPYKKKRSMAEGHCFASLLGRDGSTPSTNRLPSCDFKCPDGYSVVLVAA